MPTEINIFKILSKDDKELIHSAFLSFVIFHYEKIKNEILGTDFGTIEKPKLEVPYSHFSKKKKIRFDLLIESNSKICFIENKFKSLPTKQQLDLYSKIINTEIQQKEIKKILICFSDSSKSSLPKDWKIITYKEIYDIIKGIKKFHSKKQEFFINDYLVFLGEYLQRYNSIIDGELFNLFNNPKKEDNRFWLKLMLSKVLGQIQIDQNNFTSYTHPSSHQIPLIDLYSSNLEHRFLIQFQSPNVKLYCHFDKGISETERIRIVKEKVESLKANSFEKKSSGKFKTEKNIGKKSTFIYQEKITEEIPEKDFTIINIEKYLVDFLKRVTLK